MGKLAAAGHGLGSETILIAALLVLMLSLAFGVRWRRYADTDPAGSGSPGPLVRDPASGRSAPRALVVRDDEDGSSSYVGHANLTPIGQGGARGSVTFAVIAGALRIRAVFERAAPGAHALTVQASSVCPAAGGRAVAGQNPTPQTASRGRLRDLGQVSVGPDGRGELLLFLHPSSYRAEQRAGWRGLVGKTVILAGRDGLPVACGVVVRQGGGPHH